MTVEMLGLLGIILMFVLMISGFSISISMMIPAFIGIAYIRGWETLVTGIETIIWEHSAGYTLTTIPLFILMGELLFVSGISKDLFATFRHWMGKLKGGLAMASIGASTIFAAASGSSLATTGTMGVISSKEMLDARYNKSLAAGSIVAGGTLGILIPPSTMFIIYGMLTEQSIGQLFLAGIIPGIILMTLYMLTVYITVLINPKLAPSSGSSTWKERFVSLKSTIWILLLFILVIGGMYIGLFSPTEAAGIGAFGSFIIALIKRKLTVKTFLDAAAKTLKTTGFLFAIILGAFLLNYFLAITRIPILIADFMTAVPLPDFAIFAMIIIMYIILGAFMEGIAMVVVTIPIILPLIDAMDLNLVWFGVIIVLVVEMGQISPPLRMNCYVLEGVSSIKLEEIFKGAVIFLIPLIAIVVILYLFPQIALFLPSTMW